MRRACWSALARARRAFEGGRLNGRHNRRKAPATGPSQWIGPPFAPSSPAFGPIRSERNADGKAAKPDVDLDSVSFGEIDGTSHNG